MAQQAPPNGPRPPGDRPATTSWGEGTGASPSEGGEGRAATSASDPVRVDRLVTMEGMPSLRRAASSISDSVAGAEGERGDRARMALVGLLLFECACLPTQLAEGIEAPWLAWLRPGTAGFVAWTFLVGLLAVSSLPLRDLWRHGLKLLFGIGLVGLVALLGESAVARQIFDGQPVMDQLLAGPVGPRVVLLVSVVGLVAGLTWRQYTARGSGPTWVVVTASALLAVCYLALDRIGLGDISAGEMMLGPGVESPFLGDRLATRLAWAPAIVAFGALASCVVRSSGPRLAGVLAMAFWLSVSAPLFVLACCVVDIGHWPEVLAPLKVVTLLSASVLLLGSALGAWLAALSNSPSIPVPD